jgi:hypothetical protein
MELFSGPDRRSQGLPVYAYVPCPAVAVATAGHGTNRGRAAISAGAEEAAEKVSTVVIQSLFAVLIPPFRQPPKSV